MVECCTCTPWPVTAPLWAAFPNFSMTRLRSVPPDGALTACETDVVSSTCPEGLSARKMLLLV